MAAKKRSKAQLQKDLGLDDSAYKKFRVRIITIELSFIAHQDTECDTKSFQKCT